MRSLLPLIFVAALPACGHPASIEECEEIVERVARLELEEHLGTKNAGAVKREVQSTKQALRESTLKDCVGKRITKKALGCVRQAKSAREVVEDCFE
jgi:hypothetical protein